MKQPKLTLEIHEQQHVGLRAGVFQKLANEILSSTSPDFVKKGRGCCLSLVLVTDKKIQELNRVYRKKDTPTDVLSFSYVEEFFQSKKISPGFQQNQIGELYISVPTARRQAKEHGHSLSKEIRILFIHGLLHILGYDHEKAKDREVMQGLEQQFLKQGHGLIKRTHKIRA